MGRRFMDATIDQMHAEMGELAGKVALYRYLADEYEGLVPEME